MKKVNYKLIVSGSIVAISVLIVACKQTFLEKPSIGTLNPAIMASEKGVQGILIGAYSLVDGEGAAGDGWGSAASNWMWGSVAADEAYKGSDPSDVSEAASIETWTVNSTNAAVSQKWNLCYSGISRANDALRTMTLAKDIPADELKSITGEAHFLRAFFHMELKKVFNMIPYVDETVKVGTEGSLNNLKDIWPNIEADLQIAVSNLPEIQTAAGRVNKWAAMAFLAKAYLYEHKYTEAKPLFDQIIASGKTAKGEKYSLINFFSNFNPAQKNTSESVFAAQTSVQDGSSTDWGGDPNGNYGDILNFPYNGGPGACCGFFNPSQDQLDAFKTDAAGLPLLDTWFQGKSISDPVSPYTGNLDPRADLTVGRLGIPYLDWGLHPGDAWIRNPGADGHFSPKKNVYAKSQTDQYTDAGSAYWGPTELTANNVNIMRFSDILLMAAEVEVQVGSLDKAEIYVNMIRTRAADPTGWVYKGSEFDAAIYKYKTQTTPADKYVINPYAPGAFSSKDFAMKAIMFERRLELGMEGHRFFDLVRWGIADQILNPFAQRTGATRVPYMSTATFVKGKNEYFPLPQSTIDLMNHDGTVRLKQNPGY